MTLTLKSVLRIVGAGPGDPELITIKGAKALQKADVILYDALVNPQLLKLHASSKCKLIYVGKRKGVKEFTQDEINGLIVFYARRFKNVVRLKGGDPFVFGRGHEEMAYALSRGIEVEIISGISSALAAPSVAGIPLTCRGINESFWVVTGMTASGRISGDIYHAARSSATVVILMGMTHAEKICSVFTDLRGEDEPVAVIQSASLPDQRVVMGTLKNIMDLIHENQVGSPGVIIIGKVAHESMCLKIIHKRETDYIHE